MTFLKVERSYHSTPNGWRLATFEEARDGLEMIKNQNLLNKWDRARLLDGWITGPGYSFEMGNSFNGCLGYMLLIQTEASGGPYADVYLSDRGKEVALFLCVDDWNYEVVYWLLNCWSNSGSMNVGEVRRGNIPFRNAAKFEKMNKMIGYIARRLGNEGGTALEKAGKTKYSGKDSIKEVLSGMMKIVTEEKDILQLIGGAMPHLTWYEGDEICLPDSVKTGDVTESFWSFLCDSFAGDVVEVCAVTSLADIRKMKTISISENNLMIATSILLHLSYFRTDIIHEPMAHNCKGSCAQKILSNAAEKAAGNSQKFNEMLKNNAMCRCYDETGNYGVLDKLLVIVAKPKYNDIEEGEKMAVVDMLLQCGAQPGRHHAIGKYKNKTVLHSVAKFRDEDVGTDVVKALLRRCDEQSISEFVNAADERGRTALHSASEEGNTCICGLLVSHGASVTAKDNKGMTALHYAFEGEIDKVLGVGTEIAQALIGSCDEQSMYEFVNAVDERGRTALHGASEKGNAGSCGLLVDYRASVTVQDNKGMTALHYAFEGEIGKVTYVGTEIAQALIGRCDEQSIDKFVNAADKRGRTALHGASEKGNARSCGVLIDRGALLSAQDTKGMTALHYALEGGIDKVTDVLVKSPCVTKTVDLKDNRGYTPLDIALANRDYESTAKLLSQSKEPETYFNCFKKVDQEHLLRNSLRLGFVDIVDKLFKNGIRLPAGNCDGDGKTALHLAAMCDNESNAIEIIRFKIGEETRVNVENMVAERDRKGRTVLHEAALNGYKDLCQVLLEQNSELIYIKNRDGRNPLYDAVEGEYKGTALYKQLLKAYLKKDRPEDDLMDRSGLTPLHVAASQGKAQVVKELLSNDKIKKKYLSRGDILAQTALHKAVEFGDIDTVEILLNHGAHPLTERDCDGRTALHYLVQAETEHKEELAHMLLARCESDEEKTLLLWASAAGLGTADQYLSKDDPLHFLVDEREGLKNDNLLQLAASLGNIEMTKELISRGYQIGDIRNPEWKPRNKENVKNVKRVLRQIDMIKEQGNDKPAISDSLGRLDYAQGLAALFLNPYIKPPIAVGITGSWGMGKSSLMVQTERILLTTAAQMALLQSSKLSSSALELPDIKPYELSKKGKRKLQQIYRQIKCGEQVNRNIFVMLWDYIKKCRERINRNIFVIFWDYIRSKLKQTRVKEIQEELKKFLNEYEEKFLNENDLKYLKFFKALAAMDSSDMLKTNASWPKADPSAEENVPAVLTVQYNAWKYRNDTEALAGIAVEITKELEGIMTPAQWINTCWRNTWKKKKHTLWIEIFFPSLLALVLVSAFTWIAWVVFNSDKLKEWGKAKYAWPPAAAVIIVWTLTKSVMGILKPVSAQLMQYISFPDHADKLGYQERVISDISFLKDEIGKKAYWVFIVFAWVLTTFTVLWGLITGSYIASLLFHNRSHEKAIETPEAAPASGSNLRIIVFVDDLDRCAESVILQVLSAVNLVLAVCEISVVIGMDKRLIERAIIKKYKDVNANKSLKANKELADMYLQKIIQLPLDLPDPSDDETRRFLRGQLGVLENENIAFTEDDRSSSNGSGEREAVQQNTAVQDFTINVQPPSEIAGMGPTNLRERSLLAEATREAPPQTNGDASNTRKEKPSPSILIREMLFVRYSKGEEEAFLYFQKLATDCRKHPREWKRLLNYHRLVWYIFSVSKEAKNLVGWQVQLITWIFICWEWHECMDLVIKKWKEIDLKTNAPSLLVIVEHLMEEHKATIYENSENASSEKSANSMEKKLDALEKSLAGLKKEMKELKEASDELKKEMKELKEVVSDKLKKDTKELEKHVSNELKEDIKEVKEQIDKMGSGKNEEKWNKKSRKLRENWERMKMTLEKYDVSMDGIQVFQRFRFYCIAGYLPRR